MEFVEKTGLTRLLFMDSINYTLLLLLSFGIILIIIQIFSIIRLKKTSDSKYWNIFIGIIFGNCISILLAHFTLLFITEGLNDAIIFMFTYMAVFIIDLILLIIGLIVKKKLKNNDIKLNRKSNFVATFVILLNVLILIVVPIISGIINKAIMSKSFKSYLNSKYGDNDFKINYVEKDYSYDGIISQGHSGYAAKVSMPLLKKPFTIRSYETNPMVVERASDDFVEQYYNERVNEYLSEKYDSEFDLWLEEEKIPNYLGHIPTFNELIEYNAINGVSIIKYDYDDVVRINYVIEVSVDLIKYLNITKNISFEFQKRAQDISVYDIEIIGNTLKITNDNKESYEFNINNLKDK